MMLLRRRHRELDPMRSTNHHFNRAWLMFFRTVPPGINPAGVFFTEDEKDALANDVSALADEAGRIEVEPYDGRIHNKPRLGRVHGGR